MRVAVVDSWGTSLSWWLRLYAEGCDVLVYTDASEGGANGKVGDGLVPKTLSYDELVSWAKESPEDTVVLFCQSKYGKKADALRRDGLKVIGGGEFADKLEDDRQFGLDVALAAGMVAPQFRAFTSLSDAIAVYGREKTGGVFKSDDYLESDATQVCTTSEQLVEYLRHLRERFRDKVKFIVQELVGGDGAVDFDINRWWNGEEFMGPYGLTMEKKRFLAEDLGPSTGCALNCMWWEQEPEFAADVNFEALADVYRSHEAPAGIYAYNFRLDDTDGQAYYLETTPRLGYDSEPTAALLVDSLSEFLWAVATGEGGTEISSDLAYSVRLSAPPYPHETVDGTDELSAKGIPLPNDLGNLWSPPFIGYQVAMEPGEGLYVASPEGIIGLAAAVGDDLGAMGEQVSEFVHGLHKDVSKLQARLDGVEVLRSDARKIEAFGFKVNPAILKGAE